MIQLVRRAYGLIDRSARVSFSVFAVASVLVAALEAFAVALVIPLADLLIDSEAEGLPAAARMVDRVVDVSSREEAAAVLGVIVIAAFVVKGVAAIALLRWAIGNALRQEARISRQLFARYLFAPASFHAARNSAEIQRTLNESLPLVFRRTLPFVLGTAADAFTLAAIVVVILLSDPTVAVIAIAYFLVIGFVYQRFISGRQRIAARRAHREVAERYRQVQEAVRATKEITVLHRQAHFVNQFYETKLELVDAQRVLVFYQLLPRYFLDLAFVVGGGVMTTVAFAAVGPEEGLATVGLFLTASFRLVAPLNRMMSTVTLARAAGPAIDQVIEDLDVLARLSREHRAGDVSVGRLPPSRIEVVDVGFRYGDAGAEVVRDMSMTINPGEDVGIVGATGAGKTTLLNLLLGLIDPTAGQILIGGRPLRRCRTDWQLSIGYVPQEILLIDDTIAANVAFGIAPDEVDGNRVAEVLRIAQLDAFMATLPGGVHARVGELGTRLSGGQRQRIGLARALYHRPGMLVLDEATSALDSDTEARIMATIDSLRHSLTVVTVSHRLSTLKHCDRIYLLREGRIAAVGDFDTLNASEPEFAQLVALAQLGIGPPPEQVEVAGHRERTVTFDPAGSSGSGERRSAAQGEGGSEADAGGEDDPSEWTRART